MPPPYRFVLADDHAVFRAGLRTLLERTPAAVVVAEAGSGAEALAAVAAHAPDALVLDVHMKDMLGTEVVRQLRAQGLTVPVLALSAHDDLAYVEQMARSGASGYVTKDRSPLHIVEAAVQVARGDDVWLVRQPLASPLLQLTAKERDVLRLLAEGRSNEEIGAAMALSEHTIRNHLSTLYSKINVSNARAAIAWAWKNRVLDA